MSEMFDILQNSKQKREAKQSAHPSQGIPSGKENAHPDRSGNLRRTLAIGLGVTLVGFALGQLFQQQATPLKEPVAAAKPTPAHAQVAAAPAATTEVIDRSTDKMLIRGVVEKNADTPPAKPDQSPAQSPTGRVSSKAAHSTAPSDNPQTEKELEELQNLKKELQELKNLKNNQDDDPAMNPDGDGTESVDTYAPPPPNPDGSQPNPDQQPLTR
jgi:hypothetical protein